MKTVIVALMLLGVTPLLAQEDETLFGSARLEHGGFGAAVVKATRINGKLGMLVGARGGWIINHTFSMGLGVYGLVNNVRAHTNGPRDEPYVNLVYGGLDLEYVYSPHSLVHVSIHSLVGGGGVGFRRGVFAHDQRGYDNGMEPFWNSPLPGQAWWDHSHTLYYDPYGDGWPGHLDAFFVFEPGVNIDFNFTSWFRTSLGGSYRIISGVRSPASTNKDLSGPSAMITFRFGSF